MVRLRRPTRNRGPKCWRADALLKKHVLDNIMLRYGLHPRTLLRAGRVELKAWYRWRLMNPSDRRHPMPISWDLSRGLAAVLTDMAIDQIEHNKAFMLPRQRARILAILGVKETKE